jgi:hypothetical protein
VIETPPSGGVLSRSQKGGGGQPFRSSASSSAINEARLRFLTGQIHGLSEHPPYELFREPAGGANLAEGINAYIRLAPLSDFVHALDRDCRHPPRVLGGRQ